MLFIRTSILKVAFQQYTLLVSSIDGYSLVGIVKSGLV